MVGWVFLPTLIWLLTAEKLEKLEKLEKSEKEKRAIAKISIRSVNWA